MKHRLFVPSARRGGEGAVPLLVALHGCTQTASDFAAGTRFDSVAERTGTYVVYPEQSVLRNGNRCWNWFAPEHQSRESGEPAEILALVEDLVRKHPIDANRVFVAGLSAGGAMAAILAEQAPDVFAAVGIMAGVRLHASHDVRSAQAAMDGDGDPQAASPAHLPAIAYRRQRVTVWTGAKDHTVHPSNAAALAGQFLQLFELGGSVPERSSHGDCDVLRWRDAAGMIRVETLSIRSMGHAWSGGSFRGSHTFPRGPEASDAMMAFFLNSP